MAVVADSYLGLTPVGVPPGALLVTYGACTVPLWSQGFQEECARGQATVQMAFADAMQENQESAFAVVNSKADSVQIRYYNLLAQSVGAPAIDADAYYKLALKSLLGLSSNRNLVAYIVDGDTHCFLNKRWLSTTSTLGLNGTLLPRGGDRLALPWNGAAASSGAVPDVTSFPSALAAASKGEGKGKDKGKKGKAAGKGKKGKNPPWTWRARRG